MRNIIESNLKPEAEHSSPTPDVQGFMLDYKTIYYAKDVTYAELVDYVCRFDYPKSKAISTINKFINDGSIMQVRGIELLPLLKVNELKTLLRTFGLKVSGKKAELIDRLKENVSRVELEKLLPKTTKLIRSTKGEEVYKSMLLRREELREILYSQTLGLCRSKNFMAAQNCACQYIQTYTPNYTPVFLYSDKELNQVRETLGAERGTVAIADLLCQNRGGDVHAACSIIDITKMKQAGFKFYKILTTKTSCPVCKKFDGKKIQVSKARLGVNLPPLHDGCRCCICSGNSPM